MMGEKRDDGGRDKVFAAPVVCRGSRKKCVGFRV